MQASRLDRVGAFLFSREPGTPSFEMPDQVSSRVKSQRYDRLMGAQQGISMSVNESWIGKELKVLIEDRQNGWLIGRSHRDAPEIDGLVFVEGEAEAGSIAPVTVTGAEPYDLYARTSGTPSKVRRLVSLRQTRPLAPK